MKKTLTHKSMYNNRYAPNFGSSRVKSKTPEKLSLKEHDLNNNLRVVKRCK